MIKIKNKRKENQRQYNNFKSNCLFVVFGCPHSNPIYFYTIWKIYDTDMVSYQNLNLKYCLSIW